MLGHSFVARAEKRAQVRPLGINLGLPSVKVIWKGVPGLRWVQLLPQLLGLRQLHGPPGVLVVHAGGNDLGSVKMASLLPLIKADLERFKKLLPGCIIVWSDIVARRIWRRVRDVHAIDRSRKLCNRRVSKFVTAMGGIAIRHLMLEGKEAGLLAEDGVHLSPIGSDIFLSDLQDGVEEALALLSGGGRRSV